MIINDALAMYYGSTVLSGAWLNGYRFYSNLLTFNVEYLVISGAGGGGSNWGGGGGAGGYRCNVSGENSGGNSSSEPSLLLTPNISYTILVGGGGTGGSTLIGGDGSNSFFASITSSGGAGGPKGGGGVGKNGGSGSGAAGAGLTTTSAGGSGIIGQGSDGGSSIYINTVGIGGGGGGGAGASGVSNTPSKAGDGGSGLSSLISGTSTFRAGGGGGGGHNTWGTGAVGPGIGGIGGGGNGSNLAPPATGSSGSSNTGGGGGGGGRDDGVGGAGGSGIVILKYPSTYTANFSVGVTQTTSTVGDYKISEVTATSTTSETVIFDIQGTVGLSSSNPAESPQQLQNLSLPSGSYWIQSPSMPSAIQMYYEPNYFESKPWVRVFSSSYNSTATINLLGNSIDWSGILVQRSTLDIRHTAYFTTSRLYNTDSSTTTSSSGTRTGFRVYLGGAGSHGIYNTSQAPCNWGDSSNAVGAGWNGSTCGSFPNGLIWGTGQGGTAVYANLSGTWEHWIHWS